MPTELFSSGLLIVGVVVFVLVAVPLIVASFLRNVEAGTIRMVSWLTGGTVIYRGPGKSKEIPLLTIGTTLSSKVINVDLDITDQTADVDENGVPRPIKVQVLASAIVSVGDTDVLIKTAANRFFSKHERRPDQHAYGPAVELRPARHQPADARPALLGAIDAVGIARAASRWLLARSRRARRPRRLSRMPMTPAPRTRTIRSR